MSAQGYTNRIRVQAEGRNNKVQYPGRVGLTNNPIQASVGLSPNFTTNNYTISKCSIPSFNELSCIPIIPGSIVLSFFQQLALGLTGSSFFFVVNRDSPPNNYYTYNSVTRQYGLSGALFDSGSSGGSWGQQGVGSIIGLPVYTREICIGILNNLFSSYLSSNTIDGVTYSLQAGLDSDFHLTLTLTPPIPAPVTDSGRLRYIGLFFGNAPNGSVNLGVTLPIPGVGRIGFPGAAFMLQYDAAQAGNASQIITTPYVFLDFIP